jgi:hypothetical protein
MKQDALKQPFFAKLLESQKTPEPKEGFWPPIFTTKLKDDIEQTQKYPSDNDEY